MRVDHLSTGATRPSQTWRAVLPSAETGTTAEDNSGSQPSESPTGSSTSPPRRRSGRNSPAAASSSSPSAATDRVSGTLKHVEDHVVTSILSRPIESARSPRAVDRQPIRADGSREPRPQALCQGALRLPLASSLRATKPKTVIAANASPRSAAACTVRTTASATSRVRSPNSMASSAARCST